MTEQRNTSSINAISWLFVPGSRADRFDKARSSGSGATIIDLEDAVSPHQKETARDDVASWLDAGGRAWVRINGTETCPRCRL